MHQIDITQIVTSILCIILGVYILVPHFRNARAQNPQKPFYMKTIFIVAIVAALFVINVSGAFFQSGEEQKSHTQNSEPTTKEFNSRINSYFVAQYVINRESFVYDIAHASYNVVRIMSESLVYQDFIKDMRPENPNSNAAKLGYDGSRSVKITSINFLEPQAAEIHFTIREKANHDAAAVEYNKTARIKFEYIKMNLSPEEQLINPLGFRVLEYRLADASQN